MMILMGNELKNILLHLKSCDEMEETLLRGYILGELDNEGSQIVKNHLEGCLTCKMAVEHIRELIEKYESPLPEAILARLELNIHNKCLNKEENYNDNSLKHSIVTLLKWLISPSRVAVMLTIVFAFILGGLYIYKINTPETHHEMILRGGQQLIAEFPAGVLNSNPSTFIWSKVPQAYYYSLQIYSKNKILLMKINKIKSCQYHLDDNEKKLFEMEHNYLWNVKAYDVTGKLIAESNFVKIEIH